MGHLSPEVLADARRLVDLYPEPRSALIPICHLAQGQDGWLRPEAIAEIAEIVGVSPAEVLGTASFYDMLRTEETGRYLVSVCTNVACMLQGAYELLDHAEQRLGVKAGGTTEDGMFTLEDAECLAGCDDAPCVQVNHRYVGHLDADGFDALVDDLRLGRRDDEIPRHGVLVRVRRETGLTVSADEVSAERARQREADEAVARQAETGAAGAAKGAGA